VRGQQVLRNGHVYGVINQSIRRSYYEQKCFWCNERCSKPCQL